MSNTNKYKKKSCSVSILAITAISFASCNFNANPQQNEKSTPNYNAAKAADSSKDAQLLISLAAINLEEVKLGALAQKSSKTAAVSELGKMMEQSHSKCYNDLTVLTQDKVITIPTVLTPDGDAFYTKMSKLSGVDFDKQYCNIMVNDHKAAIELLERAKESSDPAVKHFATQTLPLLQEHLNHAVACQKKYE